MHSFVDRVVLITGAGSGIGRALARELSAAGAAIAGIDCRPEALAELPKELAGRRFAGAAADVTDRAALGAAVRQLEGQLGPADVLIASAGVGMGTPAADFRAEDFETVVRINLIGVANSVAAVLPGMIERRRGHLAVLSSLASYRGLPKLAAYSASKAGVNALFDSLRVELRPLGIHTTTICPGWVRTPMTAPLGDSLPKLLEVEDVARRVVAALARRRAFVAFPAGGVRLLRLMRWLPPTWSDRLLRRSLKELKEAPPRPDGDGKGA